MRRNRFLATLVSTALLITSISLPTNAMEVSQNEVSTNAIQNVEEEKSELETVLNDLLPAGETDNKTTYSKQLLDGTIVSSTSNFRSEVSSINQFINQYSKTTAIGAPTEVRWGTGETITVSDNFDHSYTYVDNIGTAHWKKVPGSYGRYCISLEKYNTTNFCWELYSEHYVGNWDDYSYGEWTSFGIFQDISSSGDYRFRVNVTNNKAYSPYSEVFHYTLPSSRIETPTILGWDKANATTSRWSKVNDDYLYGYETMLINLQQDYSLKILLSDTQLSYDLYRFMNNTDDYVYCTTAISSNINQKGNSIYSERSAPYASPSTSSIIAETLNNALNEVEINGDYEAAKDLLDTIDVKELALAIQSNPSVRDLLEQLETSYMKETSISVNTVGYDNVDQYLDLNRVSVLGAGLNAGQDSNEVTLQIGNPQAIGETLYHNAVSFSISMNGVANNEALLYPIRITLPIPKHIKVPELLEIIHVHKDGSKETIDPTFNNDGTVSFTVTNLSDFIFAQDEKEPTSIEIRKMDEENARKASKIALNGVGSSTILGVFGMPNNALFKGATWSTSDENVVAIHSNDVSDNDVSGNTVSTNNISANTISITAKNVGNTIIEVKKGETLIASCYIRVVEKDVSANDTKMIDADDVYFWAKQLDDYVYTGSPIKPEPVIYANGKRLVKNIDYTLSWKNNINVSTNPAKQPTVTIVGKGSYSKTLTMSFNILKKNLNASDIVAEDIYVDSNGKLLKAKPVVKMGSKKLLNGKDYILDYFETVEFGESAYKDSGTYQISIIGIGNFEGAIFVDQTNIGDDEKLVSSLKIGKIKNQLYNNSVVEPDVVIKDGIKTLIKDTDYNLIYSNNWEIGKAYVTINGIGKYLGTKTVSFNIVGIPIKSYIEIGFYSNAPVVYTGKEVTPCYDVYPIYDVYPEIEAGSLSYNSYCENNVNAGKKARIVVEGAGIFSGKIVETFEIEPKDIADEDLQLDFEDSVNYRKGGALPKVSIKREDGTPLVEGKDYTISYKNNTKVTTSTTKKNKMPYILIKGKGNYTKSRKMFFSITPQSLKEISMQAFDKAYSTKAGMELSVPTLTDVNGKKLVAGVDYDKNYTYTAVEDITLDNAKVIKAGDPILKTDILPSGAFVKVTVKGKGAYTGSQSTTYMISKKDIGKAKVKIQNKYYTGESIILKPQDIVIKYADGTILSKDDYTILSYSNNEKVGTAKVKIQGINNYSGTKEFTFKIVRRFIFW